MVPRLWAFSTCHKAWAKMWRGSSSEYMPGARSLPKMFESFATCRFLRSTNAHFLLTSRWKCVEEASACLILAKTHANFPKCCAREWSGFPAAYLALSWLTVVNCGWLQAELSDDGLAATGVEPGANGTWLKQKRPLWQKHEKNFPTCLPHNFSQVLVTEAARSKLADEWINGNQRWSMRRDHHQMIQRINEAIKSKESTRWTWDSPPVVLQPTNKPGDF